MSSGEHEIAQALRKSHCAHDNRHEQGHQCAGVCKITPNGIELECSLCGPDSLTRGHLASNKARERVKAIIERAGLSWDSLSLDAQDNTLREALKDYCPYCGTQVKLGSEYVTCPCGAKFNNIRCYSTWEKPEGAGNG